MTSARLTHVTANGLGNPAEGRPAPDHLAAARIRREILANSVTFFEQDGDHAAADAARRALAEQDEIIANLQAAANAPELDFPRLQRAVDALQTEQTVSGQMGWIIGRLAAGMPICPVCGRAADHDWMTCAEADAQEDRAARADQAEILDWIRG